MVVKHRLELRSSYPITAYPLFARPSKHFMLSIVNGDAFSSERAASFDHTNTAVDVNLSIGIIDANHDCEMFAKLACFASTGCCCCHKKLRFLGVCKFPPHRGGSENL